MMQNIEGVKVYLTQDTKQAWTVIEDLHICRNCIQFQRENLFDFSCAGIEDSEPFRLNSDDSCCECFDAKDKKVEYWINKMSSIILEYNGDNDWMRQFNYHVDNGTDMQFMSQFK